LDDDLQESILNRELDDEGFDDEKFECEIAIDGFPQLAALSLSFYSCLLYTYVFSIHAP